MPNSVFNTDMYVEYDMPYGKNELRENVFVEEQMLWSVIGSISF